MCRYLGVCSNTALINAWMARLQSSITNGECLETVWIDNTSRPPPILLILLSVCDRIQRARRRALPTRSRPTCWLTGNIFMNRIAGWRWSMGTRVTNLFLVRNSNQRGLSFLFLTRILCRCPTLYSSVGACYDLEASLSIFFFFWNTIFLHPNSFDSNRCFFSRFFLSVLYLMAQARWDCSSSWARTSVPSPPFSQSKEPFPSSILK